MIGELYKRDTYRNNNIQYLLNHTIIEYDIHAAGLNLSKEYKLLSDDKIQYLASLTKDKRSRQIGLYQRNDSVFKDKLKDAFVDIRRRFFEANNLEDDQVLFIKKDAIFTLVPCENTVFGEVEFVRKNTYTSFACIDRYEFLYNPKKIDVKGIDDDMLTKHRDFMLKYITGCFRHLETSSQQVTLGYMKRFIDKYKNLELDARYYIEFNPRSKIVLKDSNITYDDYYEDKKEDIDISYNYFNIIIPFLKIAI